MNMLLDLIFVFIYLFVLLYLYIGGTNHIPWVLKYLIAYEIHVANI